MLDLVAIDDKPKLRVDHQIANLTSRPQGMQFITPCSFALAVVLVALSAIRFLGVKFRPTIKHRHYSDGCSSTIVGF
jgi:hypothetical protein